MKELVKFVSENELNEEEKRTGCISYRRLIDRISNQIYLFNEAPKLSNYDFEFIIGSDYDEENENYTEIYQYYLIDLCLDEDYHKDIIKALQNELIIAWSETLQNYVLMVDHFGTSWDYVMTGIKWTTDFNKASL